MDVLIWSDWTLVIIQFVLNHNLNWVLCSFSIGTKLTTSIIGSSNIIGSPNDSGFNIICSSNIIGSANIIGSSNETIILISLDSNLIFNF